MTRNYEVREIGTRESGGGGLWWCRYATGPERAEVLDLFGTDMLPTPYPETMPYDEVITALRAIAGNERVCFVEARFWAESVAQGVA